MDWKVAAMTFGMIFVAELGDKTQLLVFAQSAKTGAPWSVLLGAAAALVLSTAIGVAIGGAVGRLPEWIFKTVAGLMFLGMGVWILAGLRKVGG